MKFPCIKMDQHFPKSYKSFEGIINGKVVMSNYAPKTDFKNATGIDTSNFSLKSNLVSLNRCRQIKN